MHGVAHHCASVRHPLEFHAELALRHSALGWQHRLVIQQPQRTKVPNEDLTVETLRRSQVGQHHVTRHAEREAGQQVVGQHATKIKRVMAAVLSDRPHLLRIKEVEQIQPLSLIHI